MRNIETQVVALIASKFKVDQKRVTPNAKLEQLGADSLALVELLLLLEGEFEIDIPDEEALEIVTVQGCYRLRVVGHECNRTRSDAAASRSAAIAPSGARVRIFLRSAIATAQA